MPSPNCPNEIGDAMGRFEYAIRDASEISPPDIDETTSATFLAQTLPWHNPIPARVKSFEPRTSSALSASTDSRISPNETSSQRQIQVDEETSVNQSRGTG